jgi:alpha-amylase/alpha-mannosidase (GH57 family)
MIGTAIFHALGLHMHQPPDNLRLLIEKDVRTAEEIIRCYERAARYANRFPEHGRLHIGFSGILLEQLLDPDIIDRYRHIVDIPQVLDSYARAENVELIGMGYYHPIFPLIPTADWEEQLVRGREIMEKVFGRAPRGFWPPEMAFCMEMVPALVKAGYEYVVVDGVHVRPEDGLSDIFRPYLACQDGVCITVVPRNREISNGQESGLDPDWFAGETLSHTRSSPRPAEPRLVTTWSDGENGGWFRQTHEESGFFGRFFTPYMERVGVGNYPVVPVTLSSYLKAHQPTARAQVQTGAWNVGSTSGADFSQWAGTESQRKAGAAIQELSRRYWGLRRRSGLLDETGRALLERARTLILESETSCFLFWGEAWIPNLYERTVPAQRVLDRVEQILSAADAGNDSGNV